MNKVNPGPGTMICPLHDANPVFRNAIDAASKNDGAVRHCVACGRAVLQAIIVTPPYSKASDNSQYATCPSCGGMLEW